MTGSRKRKNGFIRRRGPAGGLALLILVAAGPAVLPAQEENFFYPDSFFQTPAPAGQPSGVPPLPPSAADPFALPPAGSIPLGSAEPPTTSPSPGPPGAAAPPDDPFGTPAPESRQARQISPATPEVQAPATAVPSTTVPATTVPATAVPATAVPATAATEAQAAAAPPAYSAAAPVPAAPAEAPQARQALEEAQRARLKALFPDMLPPPDQTVSALTATPPPAASEKPAEDEAAIARAGALLTQEYYGQAKILPPLDLPPAREEAKPETEEKAPARPKAPAQTKAPAQPPAAEPKAPPAKAPAAKPKTPPAKAAQGKKAPAPARGALTLVNETGDPQVGAVYQSALNRLGYTILPGPAGGFSGGPTGRTVIYYRPGAQARAQAVSRDIPGRKTLAEAPPGAAADIVVVLR